MKPRTIRFRTMFTSGFGVGRLAGPVWLVASLLTAVGADVFTLDSSQSRISISGNVAGSTVQEQGSGSLTAQYQGSILADVTGATIQFPGQSQVTALDNGSWQPLEDGSDGSAPANYGGKASLFFTTGVAALRQVQLDITSDALALVNGQFDTQGMTFWIPADASSSVAYRTEGALNDSGAAPLGGHSATGQQATASLTTAGSQEVLTIPIHYTLFFSLVSENDTTITLTGQLVATQSL